MNENAHKLIDHVAETDGLTPAIIVFGDRNDDDRMLVAGQVIREDFTKILASAAVFAEIGRPGTEEEVAEIIGAVKTAVSGEVAFELREATELLERVLEWAEDPDACFIDFAEKIIPDIAAFLDSGDSEER